MSVSMSRHSKHRFASSVATRVLDHANLERNKQSSGWAWQASKQASRQPRGEASLDGWNWSKCTWMSIFLDRFQPVATLRFTWANVPFCWPSLLFAVSSRSIPKLNICPKQTATCTKCKEPKQSIHADRSQEIQQLQTNANKTNSQRLECLATSLLHHGPENRIKLVETWRP